jgi:LmbE family N-acetylglucosaminyl deacetylase
LIEPLNDGGTLFLSPHHDDVCFNSFGLIWAQTFSKPMYLATVFTKSNYVAERRLWPFSNTFAWLKYRYWTVFPNTISIVRLKEDKRFCNMIGAEQLSFGLSDLRVRHSSKEIPNLSRPDLPLEWSVIREIQALLEKTLASIKVRTMVAPWPYGENQHLDHRLVNIAAVNLAISRPDLTLYLMDDVPYSRRPIRENVRVEGMAGSYKPFVFHLDSELLELKFKAMKLYGSQMRDDHFQMVSNTSSFGDGNDSPSETLWLPNSSS